MKEIDHHRCSELLANFIRGDLEDEQARSVGRHLDHCSACRQEYSGLSALLALEGGPLEHSERRHLHEAVGAAVATNKARRALPRFLGRRRWATRLAPALGAMALVALIAVAAVNLSAPEDGGTAAGTAEGQTRAEEKSTEAGTAEGQRGAGYPPAKPEARERAPAPAAADSAQSTRDAATGIAKGQAATHGEDLSGRVGNGSAKPRFDPRGGRLTRAKLDRLGQKTGLFSAIASTYSATEVDARRFRFARLLRNAAPAFVRGELDSCIESVSRRPAHVLPVYGAVASFRGRPALIVGFAIARPDKKVLSHYFFGVWPRHSCDRAIHYQAGRING